MDLIAINMITPNEETFVLIKSSLGIGLPSLGLGAWQCYRELAPRRWERVTGKILSSKMDVQFDGRGKFFFPVIEYEYQYKDQVFKSSRRCAGNYSSGRRRFAENVIARYPTGSTATVFVNPRRPKTSVLEYGATLLSWIPIAFGLVWVGFAILPFYVK